MLGNVSDQKVPIPNFMITRILNQEKSPDLLSHLGFKAFQPSAECPMIINGKNIPLLDVPLFHFYPLDQFKVLGGCWEVVGKVLESRGNGGVGLESGKWGVNVFGGKSWLG
nr:hypothetical protein [Tanacetum cinerariifolium]